MKILHISGDLSIGGLQNVAMDCYREAKRNGHCVDFLVFGNQKEFYETEVVQGGGRVFHIAAPAKGYVMFYKNLINIIAEGKYDIVHSHTFFNSGICARAAKKAGAKKCIVHCHSSKRADSSRLTKRIYNRVMQSWILRYADEYCACSKQAGVCMFGESVFNKKGIVIPNAINVSDFFFNDDVRKEMRSSFGYSEDEKVIGTVGNMDSLGKNQRLLLDIFAKLYKYHENYRLIMVGDGKYKCELEERARHLAINRQVIFTGKRTDVNSILSAMDLFVLPSIHEGFGIVLIEAQANGLPCIGLNGVIASEAIVSDYVYLINDVNDMEEWKDAFVSFLERCHGDRKCNLRKLEELNYNFKKIIGKIYS